MLVRQSRTDDRLKIELHITRNKKEDEEFRAALVRIMAHAVQTMKEIMMATSQELEARLQGISDTVGKIHAETTASVKMVADLRAELEAGGQISPAAMAKLDQIEAQLMATDSLVADAAPAEGQTVVVEGEAPPPPPAA